MMRTESEQDTNACLRDVMEVELGLGGKGSSLSICVLDHADSTEGEEGFGRVRIEFRILLVELGVGTRSRGEGGLGSKIDTISYVLLEVDNEFGRKDILQGLEDGNYLFIDLLYMTFSFVAMRVRSCMSNLGMKETKGCGEGETDWLRVGTELANLISLSIVHGDKLLNAGHDVIAIFGFSSEHSEVSAVIINEGQGLGIVSDGWRRENLEVKEYTFADGGSRGRVAGHVDVLVMKLARSTGDTGSIELGHEINICTSEVGVAG